MRPRTPRPMPHQAPPTTSGGCCRHFDRYHLFPTALLGSKHPREYLRHTHLVELAIMLLGRMITRIFLLASEERRATRLSAVVGEIRVDHEHEPATICGHRPCFFP